MRSHLGAVVLALAAVAVPGSASALNLLTNGDFEADITDFAPGLNVETVLAGSSTIDGWVVSQESVDLIKVAYNAISGVSVDVAGSPGPGAITQSFAATAGSTYTLTWDYSNNGGTVLIATVGTTSQSFTPTNAVQQGQLIFVAPASQTYFVSFSSGSSPVFGGPVVDNVVLTSAVPEGGSLAMMLAGLAGIGFRARQRRRD